MRQKFKIGLLVFLMGCTFGLKAQENPFVDLFKPIGFIGGFPTSESPTADNFELKFQYSVALNLWHNIGGRHWNGFFGYTQVSLWDFFAESSPFRDNMFMPGIYCSHHFSFHENGKPRDELLLAVEHRSNGKTGMASRSLNALVASYSRDIRESGLTLQGALRWGTGHLYDGDPVSRRILTHNLGYMALGATWHTSDDKWAFHTVFIPLFHHQGANLHLEATWKVCRRDDFPRLCLQYHYGYDEVMLDCRGDRGPTSYLRFGFVINPHYTLFP